MNVEIQPPTQLLKAAEVAKRLSISKAFAYQLMAKGAIRTVKIQRSRRVLLEDLQHFIQENRSK